MVKTQEEKDAEAREAIRIADQLLRDLEETGEEWKELNRIGKHTLEERIPAASAEVERLTKEAADKIREAAEEHEREMRRAERG